MHLWYNSFCVLYILQTIGYFIATVTQVRSPPLVLIITDVSVRMLLFPFIDPSNGDDLLNAICFNNIPLWHKGKELNWEVLVMIITLLTSADRRKPIIYPGKCAVAKRMVHDKVQTDREVLESKIQEKLRVEFEARIQQLQRELSFYKGEVQ